VRIVAGRTILRGKRLPLWGRIQFAVRNIVAVHAHCRRRLCQMEFCQTSSHRPSWGQWQLSQPCRWPRVGSLVGNVEALFVAAQAEVGRLIARIDFFRRALVLGNVCIVATQAIFVTGACMCLALPASCRRGR